MEEKNNKSKKTNTTVNSRKLSAQREADRQERINKMVSIGIAVVAAITILILFVISPIIKRHAGLKEYFKVNDISVSELEFNYYTTRVTTNFISTYGAYLSYLGLDTSADLSTQIYDSSTGLTWDEFFKNQAVNSIMESKALLADMKAKGVTVDITETLEYYLSSLKSSAEAQSLSVDKYVQKVYGVSANEARITEFIKEEVTAATYYEKLMKDNTVDDAAVDAEIEANEIVYTSVDYRILPIYADVADDATEAEITAAMETATAKANEMLEKVKAGEDFETLCFDYASLEEKTEYNDPDTDKSLQTWTDLTPSDYYAEYANWLFDDSRKAGDSQVFSITDDKIAYVVKYEKRYIADSTKDTVRDSLTSKVTNEYLDNLTANYQIVDTKENLLFMKKLQESVNSSTSENTESTDSSSEN